MRSRAATVVVLTLVLLHQLVGGVFGGGTVLCVSAGGIALQPVGLTCCPAHASATDACCPDEAPVSCSLASTSDCQGCVDHALTMQPAVMLASVTAPAPAQEIVAILAWPAVERAHPFPHRRWATGAPPPAVLMLSTVVLRI